MTSVAILAGAIVGLGVALLSLSLYARPSLADRLATVTAAAGSTSQRHLVAPASSTSGRGRWEAWLEQHIGRRVTRLFVDASVRADLNLLGIDPAEYTARQVVGGLVGVLATPLLVAGFAAVTGLPWYAGAWITLVGAGLGIVIPSRRVRAQARDARRTFLSTVVSYLELVAMRSASGSAVSEALRDAASVGSGYGWQRLRSAMRDARAAGLPPAAAMTQLGTAVAIPELAELGVQLDLVDSTGAQAETTLRAKADALRERLLTELHGDATARSQTLVLGQFFLAGGYVILVGYPALVAVLNL